MTAPHILNPACLLDQALSDASPDLMRRLLSTVINALLSAEADAVCGAEWGQPSAERVNQRNGFRHRELDTRVGTVDVAVPKLRQGWYFPEWLLERRKRAESALMSVVATCYLLGVSTRRMDKLVATLGITSLSKSQVSRMAAELDEQVAADRVTGGDGGTPWHPGRRAGHRQPRPQPGRAPPPAGHHRRRPGRSPRRPGHPRHPPGLPGRQPHPAHGHRGPGHQPAHPPGKRCPAGRMAWRAPGSRPQLPHVRDGPSA
jgi:Transposase, Mutator family